VPRHCVKPRHSRAPTRHRRGAGGLIRALNEQITQLQKVVARAFWPSPGRLTLPQPAGFGLVLGRSCLGEFRRRTKPLLRTARARKNYSGQADHPSIAQERASVLARYATNRAPLGPEVTSTSLRALGASPGARPTTNTLRERRSPPCRPNRQLGHRLVGILHGCLKTGTVYGRRHRVGAPPRPRRTRPGLTKFRMGCLSVSTSTIRTAKPLMITDRHPKIYEARDILPRRKFTRTFDAVLHRSWSPVINTNTGATRRTRSPNASSAASAASCSTNSHYHRTHAAKILSQYRDPFNRAPPAPRAWHKPLRDARSQNIARPAPPAYDA